MENSTRKIDFWSIMTKTARAFGRREVAFVAALIGVIAQMMHIFWLSSEISQFDGAYKFMSSTMISIVLSVSLLYFTILASRLEKPTVWYDIIFNKVNFFWIFEISINISYYIISVLMVGGEFKENITVGNWFFFVIAVIVSSMIPTVIKLFAGSMRIYDPEETERIVDRNLLNEFMREVRRRNKEDFEKYTNDTQLDAVGVETMISTMIEGSGIVELEQKFESFQADASKLVDNLIERYKNDQTEEIKQFVEAQENALSNLEAAVAKMAERMEQEGTEQPTNEPNEELIAENKKLMERVKSLEGKLRNVLRKGTEYPVTIGRADGTKQNITMQF